MKDSRRIFLSVSFPTAGFKILDLAVGPAAKLGPRVLGPGQERRGDLLKFKGASGTPQKRGAGCLGTRTGALQDARWAQDAVKGRGGYFARGFAE